MTHYFKTREDVVRAVNVALNYFKLGSQWTMTITQEKSGGYCVSTVTDMSSDDTDLQTAWFFSETQVNT